MQKISRQNYCLLISPKYLIPYAEERSSEYYKHMVFPKKLLVWWYPEETMTDADNLMLLTPAQAESILNSLEQTAESIGLYMNTNKTDFICFKQEAIAT